jgi:cysteine desulfurase
MRSIFLDFNSTTPVAASVRDCMLPFLSEFYGHPSSSHWFGRAAQEAIEDARSNVATLIGCHPSEVIFTSGGTESVNLALLGAARAINKTRSSEKLHFVTTVLEHTCVRRTAEFLEQMGWEITIVGCDRNGRVRVDEFRNALRPNTVLASVIHASHQFGTLQPVSDIAEIIKGKEIILHTDAAQSIGKVECSVEGLGVDLLSFSGHKFYAPKGIGGLYVRMGIAVEPIFHGEGNEGGLRPGTENVPHIVGLGQAAKLMQSGVDSSMDRLADMRDRFRCQLESLLGLPLKVVGDQVPRLPHVLTLELPRVSTQALQQRLPEICFGPSAAVPDSSAASRWSPYAAMGMSEQQASRMLRISIGWTTSEEEQQQALQLIAAAHESLSEEGA